MMDDDDLLEDNMTIEEVIAICRKVRQDLHDLRESIGPFEDAIGLEHSTVMLGHVHDPKNCTGRPCALHNRTDHHMRWMVQHWRDDRGIIERICNHGVGHPDPDQAGYMDEVYGSGTWAVHGCCGCCIPPMR